MTTNLRRWALAAASVATLLAVAWTAAQEESVTVEPAAAVSPAADKAAAAPAPETRGATPAPENHVKVPAPARQPEFPDIAALESRRTPFQSASADPFAVKSWKPRVVERPSAPSAPPLPYTYFGRMSEDGRQYVFLQRGERTYMVTGGDVIDRDYRIEGIAADAVVITYLPLKERQVLHTGS